MIQRKSRMLMGLILAAGTALGAMGQNKPEPVRYDGYRVVRVEPTTQQELDRIIELSDSVWSERVGVGPIEIQVSPEHFAQIRAEGFAPVVLIDDLQKVVDRERAEIAAANANRARGGDAIDFTNYYPFADHVTYMNQLVAERPDLASIQSIGQTLQSRDIWTVNVTGPGDASNRPQVAINATIHAREWIVTPTAQYLLTRLVRDYDTDPRVRNIVDTVDWYITPVLNADGYVYTWTSDRYWRKNRRNNGGGSFGVDLNRNFDIDWGGNGSSGDPNSETYRGTAPFSEPESTVISNFMASMDDLRAHVDTHSYSQLVLHAPGTFAQSVPNESALHAVAVEMSDAILATNGAFYTPQRGLDLYEAAGTFSDWSGIVLGAYAYTIEARPTGGGLGGFSPPASEILPTAQEIYQAYMTLAELRTQPLRFVVPASAWSDYSDSETRTVVFSVLDALNQPLGANVKAFVRVGSSGGFTEVAATPLGNDQYSVDLSAGGCNSTLEFYFQAMTSTGTAVDFPANGSSAPIVASVTADVVTFSDNAETNTGWTVSGDATDGQWNRGVPANGGRGDPAADADGSGQAWLTDNVAGNSDVDNGETILTSTQLDAPAGSRIGYSYWFNDIPGGEINGDSFRVQVSTDGGAYTTVRTITSAAGTWRTDELVEGIDFSASSNLRLRFIANDIGTQNVIEAGLDAVSITVPGNCNPVCLPDVNGDGMVTAADFTAWVAAFNAGDPECDQNSDGACTAADFTAWVANFNAGCP